MLRVCLPTFGSLRLYSQVAEKPFLKLVAEMRKPGLTEVSITNARDALVASNNDSDVSALT